MPCSFYAEEDWKLWCKNLISSALKESCDQVIDYPHYLRRDKCLRYCSLLRSQTECSESQSLHSNKVHSPKVFIQQYSEQLKYGCWSNISTVFVFFKTESYKSEIGRFSYILVIFNELTQYIKTDGFDSLSFSVTV